MGALRTPLHARRGLRRAIAVPAMVSAFALTLLASAHGVAAQTSCAFWCTYGYCGCDVGVSSG